MFKRFLAFSLVTLCLGLQYKLWLAPGGWLTVRHLQHQVFEAREQNYVIEQLNATLVADIENLKRGDEMLEQQARLELGMIHRDESFYRYI